MYGEYSTSLPQKMFLSILHLGAVLVSTWLLFGGGIELVGTWLGVAWGLASLPRRLLLLGCSLVYFARLFSTVSCSFAGGSPGGRRRPLGSSPGSSISRVLCWAAPSLIP